jgi:hypothetical protein
MTEIGAAWKRGELEIRYEHFATACLRGLLHELRQPFDQARAANASSRATLPGDTHDLGLLMVSLMLAVRGRRVLYMGADLPLHETVRTAVSQNCTAVAISVSLAYGRDRAAVEIRAAARAAAGRHRALGRWQWLARIHPGQRALLRFCCSSTRVWGSVCADVVRGRCRIPFERRHGVGV